MEDTIEAQCENLMNIVVETRKRFKNMCVDYERKTSVMENNLLKLQTETIANYNFKPKCTVSDVDTSDMVEIDSMLAELEEKKKRIEDLKLRAKHLKKIVIQLNSDNISKKLKEPIDPETMFVLDQ